MKSFDCFKKTFLFRGVAVFTVISFLSVMVVPRDAFAQVFMQLPAPGTMVTLTDSFIPTHLKGIKLYPKEPFKFNFIIDTGNETSNRDHLQEESNKLVKYFMAALTVPENEMWVNLSPYEHDRIIPPQFGATDMGRDLLMQDYMLKQLTSSLMYPEDDLGAEFWKRVYERAEAQFGITDIPVNTFNKIWIVPENATVYEHSESSSAFVVKRSLKVMLEEDFVALQKERDVKKYGMEHLLDSEQEVVRGVTADVVREVLVPEIEKEVNEGKMFAQLRQIYDAMILATWYKQSLRGSLLGQMYVDQNKVSGIDIADKDAKEKIYQQYLEAFKVGVYDYIKEEYDPINQQIIPRKYFSGGFSPEVSQAMTVKKVDNGRFSTFLSGLMLSALMFVSVSCTDVSNIPIVPPSYSAGNELRNPASQAVIDVPRVEGEAPLQSGEMVKAAEIFQRMVERVSSGTDEIVLSDSERDAVTFALGGIEVSEDAAVQIVEQQSPSTDVSDREDGPILLAALDSKSPVEVSASGREFFIDLNIPKGVNGLPDIGGALQSMENYLREAAENRSSAPDGIQIFNPYKVYLFILVGVLGLYITSVIVHKGIDGIVGKITFVLGEKQWKKEELRVARIEAEKELDKRATMSVRNYLGGSLLRADEMDEFRNRAVNILDVLLFVKRFKGVAAEKRMKNSRVNQLFEVLVKDWEEGLKRLTDSNLEVSEKQVANLTLGFKNLNSGIDEKSFVAFKNDFMDFLDRTSRSGQNKENEDRPQQADAAMGVVEVFNLGPNALMMAATFLPLAILIVAQTLPDKQAPPKKVGEEIAEVNELSQDMNVFIEARERIRDILGSRVDNIDRFLKENGNSTESFMIEATHIFEKLLDWKINAGISSKVKLTSAEVDILFEIFTDQWILGLNNFMGKATGTTFYYTSKDFHENKNHWLKQIEVLRAEFKSLNGLLRNKSRQKRADALRGNFMEFLKETARPVEEALEEREWNGYQDRNPIGYIDGSEGSQNEQNQEANAAMLQMPEGGVDTIIKLFANNVYSGSEERLDEYLDILLRNIYKEQYRLAESVAIIGQYGYRRHAVALENLLKSGAITDQPMLEVVNAAIDAINSRNQQNQFNIGAGNESPDMKASAAMLSGVDPVGGIDLDAGMLNLQIKRDGSGMPLPMNLQPPSVSQIQSLTPVIINITPVTNLPMMLGIAETDADLTA